MHQIVRGRKKGEKEKRPAAKKLVEYIKQAKRQRGKKNNIKKLPAGELIKEEGRGKLQGAA